MIVGWVGVVDGDDGRSWMVVGSCRVVVVGDGIVVCVVWFVGLFSFNSLTML